METDTYDKDRTMMLEGRILGFRQDLVHWVEALKPSTWSEAYSEMLRDYDNYFGIIIDRYGKTE